MSIKDIILSGYKALLNWPKRKLVEAIQILKERYKELEEQNKALKEENARLKEELNKQEIRSINERANKPSSKQPEWEVKGVGAKPSFKPEIILVKQEKKYCNECKLVITASSELALPKSDIGLNATILICYLWVALCLPFTRISNYLKTFFGLDITTSGISRHVIRVSKILKTVHEEILQDIKIGLTLYADETEWRVKGRNWWLWVFGTQDSAYFTIDKSQGSKVVRRVLGEIFLGVLVVDGWRAYLSLICEQQSCMAHLLRKIRKFRAAFPHLSDIAKFYIKLRRIIRDGERLQEETCRSQFKWALNS